MVRVELLDYTRDGEKLVALAAKRSVSPQATPKVSEEEVDKLVVETLKRGHWSPWEFSNYVFDVECSRVCTHQLVRHRIASYIQLSQRYGLSTLKDLLNEVGNMVGRSCTASDYSCHVFNLEEFEKKLSEARNQVEEDTLLSVVERYFYVPSTVKQNREVYGEYIAYVLASIKLYLTMLVSGVPHEDARYILPQSVGSRLMVQMNARELATSFLPLRTCARAQKELRCVAWRMLMKLETVHPKLFGYVGPRCVLVENMVRDQPLRIRDVINPEVRVEFTIGRCPEGVPRESIRTCVINSYKSALDL
ncbi:MAG: FAD-dependent thymidylate synthase [Thermofilaceae archaeon]